MPASTPSSTNSDDVLSSLGKEVFGTPLDKILIIAVLTSAAASTQTTILPTARTSLSMARAHAMPKSLGAVHETFQTPHSSTAWMGVASIVWYVGLTLISENILFDSIAALGLMIAFYYAMTGFACAWFYRRELMKGFWNFFSAGLMPTVGALILTYVFIKSCVDLSDPANSESGTPWFGLGPPLIIGIGMLLFGFVLMYWQKSVDGRFWEQKATLAPSERSTSRPRKSRPRSLLRASASEARGLSDPVVEQLIGGERVAGDGEALGVENPFTEETIASVAPASAAQLDAAIAAAARAQRGWENTPAVERAEMLHEVANRMRARTDELAALMTPRAASRWSRTPTRSAGPPPPSTTTPRSAATRPAG